MNQQLLTSEELAVNLRCHVDRVYRLVKGGKVTPEVDLKPGYLFDYQKVLKQLAFNRNKGPKSSLKSKKVSGLSHRSAKKGRHDLWR